jgi:UDPglucose 6-dehydrogenase
VVGIGKLGLCLAVVLAARGFRVTGVDSNEGTVRSVNAGESPIYEPGVKELIAKNRKRFTATSDFGLVADSEVTFIVVPTPSEESGLFSLRYVLPAIENVGKAISSKRGYHLVVLTSTVSPGSLDRVIKERLESSSGKSVGSQVGLCYSPELIALGDVLRGLTAPEFVIIGESDPKAGDMLLDVKNRLHRMPVPASRMSFVNAEITKIALNSFITMKMSFANTLAELCERLPGANVDVVTKAIGNDSRIGPKYLKGAIGYGGPCFPRDNVAFAASADEVGAQAKLAQASHEVNLRQLSRIASMVKAVCPQGKPVSLLGLAYKPKTNVLEASQAFLLATELCKEGREVYAYDPAAEEIPLPLVPGGRLHIVGTLEDCLSRADCVVVASPLDDLRKVGTGIFAGKTVVDCWRVLPEGVEKVARYIPLGRYREDVHEVAKSTKRSSTESRH